MNTDKLAQGLRQLGEAVYEIADALLDTAIESGREAAVPPAVAPAPTYEASPFEEPPLSLADASVDFADQGAEAVCPKHRTPYKDGNYGPFCTQLSDDPAWANKKGYCNITPKNAAQYLRVRAAA